MCWRGFWRPGESERPLGPLAADFRLGGLSVHQAIPPEALAQFYRVRDGAPPAQPRPAAREQIGAGALQDAESSSLAHSPCDTRKAQCRYQCSADLSRPCGNVPLPLLSPLTPTPTP